MNPQDRISVKESYTHESSGIKYVLMRDDVDLVPFILWVFMASLILGVMVSLMRTVSRVGSSSRDV